MERSLVNNFNNGASHTFDKVATSHTSCKNPHSSPGMEAPKSSHHVVKDSGSRSEQGFRIEGLKQSIIAVYGDAMDKIGFSITEKANRSAQSRLGKTLRHLETMEYKEQTQYRRQKQELLDSLDRLQGEKLRIRKLKHRQNQNSPQKQYQGYKSQTLPDEFSVSKDEQQVARGDYIDRHHEDDIVEEPSKTGKEMPETTTSGHMIALKHRPSSTIAVARKPSEDARHLLRPLTPEIPCHLPKINGMQMSLIATGFQDVAAKSVVIKAEQPIIKLIQPDHEVLDSDYDLQSDSVANRERRSASFSQYGHLQRPKLSREPKYVSPLATNTREPISYKITACLPKQSINKSQSQNNSPLLPKRQFCRGGKDWIPPEKEELLAELKDYKLELQERVNHFLAQKNPQ